MSLNMVSTSEICVTQITATHKCSRRLPPSLKGDCESQISEIPDEDFGPDDRSQFGVGWGGAGGGRDF